MRYACPQTRSTRPVSRRALVSLVFGLFLLLVPLSSAASAQGGRAELNAGLAAARSGQWEQARTHFERAYEITGREAILINLAGAERQTGRLVEAAATYQRFIDDAGRADRQHIPTAQAALEDLRRILPYLTVSIATGSDGDVYLNGNELRSRELGQPQALNPGTYRLELRDGGNVLASQSVTLRQGSRETVVLQAPRLVPSTPTVGSPPTTQRPSRRRRTGLWVGIGVGSAVAIGGAVALGLLLGGRTASGYTGNFGDGSATLP